MWSHSKSDTENIYLVCHLFNNFFLVKSEADELSLDLRLLENGRTFVLVDS